MSPSLCFCLLVLNSTLLCSAQNKAATDKPAPQKPVTPAAATPSTPIQAPDSTKPEAGAKAQAPYGIPNPADSYVIGPADVLTVNVWKDQTLTGSYLVRPDGMISLPLVGDVPAADVTALELADRIASKLKKYMQNPTVTVVVTQIHSKLVYMFGEVARKGPIEMTSGMTILEAIAAAGGLTDFANTRKIYILRNYHSTRVTIPVHYKQALKGDRALDLVLEPDDKIVVP